MKKALQLFLLLFISFSINAQIDFTEHVFPDDDYPFHDEVLAGDLNGDGIDDVVAVGRQARMITVGYNSDGYGTFDTYTFPTEFTCFYAILLDFDSDGDLDILASAPFESASFWWRNDGEGDFVRNDFPVADYTKAMVADMNNDGKDDIVMDLDDQLKGYTFENGVLTPLFTFDPDVFGFNPKAMATVDANDDGLLDILTADAFDGILLIEQTSLNTFNKIELLPEIKSIERIEVSDFNNDGLYDIFAASAFNGTSRVLTNNGDGTFSDLELPIDIERIEFSFLADVDSDGDADVVNYDSGFGQNGVLKAFVNNTDSWSSEMITDVYPKLESGFASDIDGDSDIDLTLVDNTFFNYSVVILENNKPLSDNEIAFPEFIIQPTLVDQYTEVKTAEKLNYRISNINGQILDDGVIEFNKIINTSNWSSGIYFIEMTDGRSVVTQKLVK